jgi:hypothetical protein
MKRESPDRNDASADGLGSIQPIRPCETDFIPLPEPDPAPVNYP